MPFIEKALGSSPRISSTQDLERLVLKEMWPLLQSLVREVNRSCGDLVSLDEDGEHTIDRKTRFVVYDHAGTATVTLPPARDVSGQAYTVFRTNAAGVVTVVAGSSMYSPSAGASVEVLSDGSAYHAK